MPDDPTLDDLAELDGEYEPDPRVVTVLDQVLAEAGVDEPTRHAARMFGFVITEANAHWFSDEMHDEWEAAVDSWHLLHGPDDEPVMVGVRERGDAKRIARGEAPLGPWPSDKPKE